MDGIAIVRTYIDRMLDPSNNNSTTRNNNSNNNNNNNNNNKTLMKAFLLDAVTTQIVSAVYSQTELLQQQVYLVTRLDDLTSRQRQSQSQAADDEDVSHLTAICCCRPTPQNVQAIGDSVARCQFAAYSIYFTAPVPMGLLRVLAEHDGPYERIVSVQEYFCDFCPVNAHVWTLNSGPTSLVLTTAAGTSWAPKYAAQYERHLLGLQSMLLALRRQPVCIRYAGHSACAEELAQDLHEAIVADDIFHFRGITGTSNMHHATTTTTTPASQGGASQQPQPQPPLHPAQSSSQNGGGGLVVLILDRRDDPVTPLLSQWTYQAMVHELLGLNNHRVVLKGAPNMDNPELDEVVLSTASDAFFAQHLHSNFGELGEAIQLLLQQYQQAQQHSTSHAQFQTVEEMQAFMEKFPELRSQSHTVSKHVALMSELARLVETCSLLDVSQLEQELASNHPTSLSSTASGGGDDHSSHWRQVLEKLNSPTIKVPDKLRLGLLYALRYESLGNLHMLQSAMIKGGVPTDMVQSLVPTLLRYGGRKSRGPGLFGHHQEQYSSQPNVMTKMITTAWSGVVAGGVAGVDNVYAQHVPLVLETLQALTKGKLSTKTHPMVPGSCYHPGIPSNTASTWIPHQVLVFMVGGITYEEGTKIHQTFSSGNGNPHIVLAGSTVHNSTSFLDELKATAL